MLVKESSKNQDHNLTADDLKRRQLLILTFPIEFSIVTVLLLQYMHVWMLGVVCFELLFDILGCVLAMKIE
jgi:hypothetical protein